MMNFNDIFNFFKKNDDTKNVEIKDTSINGVKLNTSLSNTKNWYSERYDSLIVQRNLIFMLSVVLSILSLLATCLIVYVTNLRTFEPFVIQLDNETGIAQIVTPASSDILTANDSLARYFIQKYIIARETYNPVDFDTRAKEVTRILSSREVYRSYIAHIRTEEFDPSVIYGQNNSTFLVVKSWSKLNSQKYLVRFALYENEGQKRVYHKIAVVEYKYTAMELNESEREINPVGFQITAYRSDDDNS